MSGIPVPKKSLLPPHDDPATTSQSFSQSYGSILPTSLTYIVLPPEAAHLEDLLRLSVRPGPATFFFPRVFTDQKPRLGIRITFLTPPKSACCAPSRPFTPRLRYAAHRLVHPTPSWRPQALLRHRSACPGARISTGFPVELENSSPFGVPHPPLGSAYQCPTPVVTEPFPTSVFKGSPQSLLLLPRSALGAGPHGITPLLAPRPHVLLS